MKRVALINDLSGFGRCSLTAAIPVISVMGHQACPLPTAVLTSQTEFEDYYCDDFTDRMDCFTETWRKLGISFDGIYSGYLTSSLQIDKLLHFLEVFEKEDTFYLADPVMGDEGVQYDMFNEQFLQGMRELTHRADVITPNLTELCLLAGEDYGEVISHRQDIDYIKRIQTISERLIAKAQKPQTVMVTGILHEKAASTYIGNLAVTEKESFYAENLYTGTHFSGTGDLFASIICGALLKGLSAREAVEKATAFLQMAIADASAEDIPPNHGVQFEKYLAQL